MCMEHLCLRMALFLPEFSKEGRSREGRVWDLCRNPETELSESMFWGLPLVPGGILSHLGLYSGAVWPRAQLQREARLWMWNDREDNRESISVGATEPAMVGTL